MVHLKRGIARARDALVLVGLVLCLGALLAGIYGVWAVCLAVEALWLGYGSTVRLLWRTRARWVPVAGVTLGAWGAWYGLQIHQSSASEDVWLLRYISTVYAAVAVIMLVGTTAWSLRGLGMFTTYSADAVLYHIAAGGHIIGVTYGDPTLDVPRVLLAIGGTLTGLGVILWVYQALRLVFLSGRMSADDHLRAGPIGAG